MSRLTRLLPNAAAGRRAYSFFSSKPGGGRYFNSAKPPKVVTSSPAGASATKVTSDPPTPTAEATETDGERAAKPASTQIGNTLFSAPPMPPHPLIKPHEFKLHHFFSLHRPLLLLNQPTTALFEAASLPAISSASAPPVLGTIDDPPEASPEADADAARQLSRALVINRVGSTVDWGTTLQRLGYVSAEVPLVEPLPTVEVHLDSTKRKRKSKMKKHKLKKRRRLQRFERLKMKK